MKNKGFSLVELIIVIAIMAILAAAIAPALIRYIDKSRRADDVAAAESVNTAAQAAFSNEEAYDEVQNELAGPTTKTTDKNGDSVVKLAESNAGSSTWTGVSAKINTTNKAFLTELSSNVGSESPKVKYTKELTGGQSGAVWVVGINEKNNKPVVWLADKFKAGTDSKKNSDSIGLQLQPSITAPYK